jgi:hypothetical protein
VEVHAAISRIIDPQLYCRIAMSRDPIAECSRSVVSLVYTAVVVRPVAAAERVITVAPWQ